MLMPHNLVPHLKRLKLSGVLATLEYRHQQAIDQELSYIDFLAGLLEDEVERREAKKLHTRLRRSSLDLQKTLEAFDFRFNKAVKRQQVLDLAAGGYIENRRNVLIVGPAGVGKTHLAQALGHEACRRGHHVQFWDTRKLLKHLHAGRADHSLDRRFAALARADLLILDDFALKPLGSHHAELLYDLIAERYERASVLVTSNRAFEEWPAVFGDPLLASAALDRLAHDAHQLIIEGRSYRTGRGRRRPREEQERDRPDDGNDVPSKS